MQITRLSLWNYRNYEALRMELPQGISLITGKNAQGKTNLLESIFLCSTGRSHRTRKDRDLIRWGEKAAQVMITSKHRYAEHSVKITLGATREIEVNSAKITKAGEMLGYVNSVLFAPEDLRLIKEGPQERRRYLDMAISQADTAYFYALQRYNRALQQRNTLLRQISAGQAKIDALELWNEQLIKQAAIIHLARLAFVNSVCQNISGIHRDIAGGAEEMELRYRPSPNVHGDNYAAQLLTQLRQGRNDEVRQGITLVGPHRDELIPSIQGRDARIAASQGQQRTAALAMRLCQVLILKEITQEWPVLLLDDVMSELDEYRRDALLKWIGEAQTLITAAQDGIQLPKGARVFTVESGRVTGESGGDVGTDRGAPPHTSPGISSLDPS